MAQRRAWTAHTGRGRLAAAPCRPHKAQQPNSPKAFGRLKPLEAFFSTEVSLSPHAIVETYADRWAMEIDIRDSHAYDGVAQDQCRTFEHIMGAHTLHLLLAAARTLWCIVTSEHQADVALQRFRPWYRPKVAPSQFDVAWACREALQEAGIFRDCSESTGLPPEDVYRKVRVRTFEPGGQHDVRSR
jgi:hypothetical protein